MTTPIEEMVSTFCRVTGCEDEPTENGKGIVTLGLLAVLDKHVGPMLAEVHAGGWNACADPTKPFESSIDYAARILKSVKGE